MAIFNSYVSLPEGNCYELWIIFVTTSTKKTGLIWQDVSHKKGLVLFKSFKQLRQEFPATFMGYFGVFGVHRSAQAATSITWTIWLARAAVATRDEQDTYEISCLEGMNIRTSIGPSDSMVILVWTTEDSMGFTWFH